MKVKNVRRRRRSARKKAAPIVQNNGINSQDTPPASDVEIEYVVEPPRWEDVPGFSASAESFSEFLIDFVNNKPKEVDGEDGQGDRADEGALTKGDSEMKNGEVDENDNREYISSKKVRKLNRLSVAELKNLVEKPEVVDWYDITAADPKLLVNLKSYRNTVPVPAHWCQKRKYLQGKRGIEKSPFELPDFIKATGIAEIRSAVKEKEDASRLKTKTRERHQPKMGKLDMDYQKLHDAFFRWQTKPRMTIHGDIYYEGKEFETKLKTNKPGRLSDELTTALGMPHLAPPPWLINMQRHGPPPSYPQLKIPGLNAPIPEGASWGYHPGGWGKPPVDEYGRPLYGDIFGTIDQELHYEHTVPVNKIEWGKLIEYEYDDEHEQESPKGEVPTEDILEGVDSRSDADTQLEAYTEASSGTISVPNGLETPESIELRKSSKISTSEPKLLYTVIQEKSVPSRGFLGPQHVYDVPTQAASGARHASSRRSQSPGVEVALNPEELQEGIDSGLVKNKYEQHLQVSKKTATEDLSGMVAEYASKQSKRRQRRDDKKEAADKKYSSKRNSSALRGADEDSGSDDRSHEPVARDSFYSKGKRDNVEKTLEDVLSFALRDVLSKDDGPLEKIVETVTAKIAAMDDESVAESINGIPRTASESRIPVGDLPLGYNDRGQSAAENELSDAQYLVGSAYLLRGKSQGGFQRVNSANRVGAGSNAKYHTTPNVRVSKICGAHSTILNTRVDDCTNLVLSAEFLMDNGAAAFFPPVADYPRALKHWRRALETADRACAPILKAKILSNVSCALSSIRREEEALVLMKVAWTLTLSYIRSVPNHRESYWMDFMRTILNIDSQAAAHMGPFVCRVDCGSHGGIVSMLTVPDKHASGALIVTWVLQLAINMGNRYYKLNNIENASKYYILTKILSECVIEDILSSGPTRNSSKSDLRSAFFLPRPLSHQIYSPILSSNRSKIKHSPPSPLKLRQTFSLGPTGLQYKNGTHSRVKLNYIIFQALLCNAKSLSYLGVCYSCSPSLKSRSLPLHLEAENRIMRLLSLTSIELNENSSESPPLALIESKFACSCILLNLNLAYREEGKLNLATVYSDLSLKTYHDYVNLLTSFYSSVKISAPNQEPQK